MQNSETESMHFKDRQDAGRRLADALRSYKGQKNLVVYAIPRGGVILGAIVAKFLDAGLDLLIPRKIGHPDNPEYAIAAVGESGDMVRDEQEFSYVDQKWFRHAVAEQRAEARRRRKLYLGNRKPVSASGQICIIVDDGLATGLTMKAAIKQVRCSQPQEIVVAVPVAPADTIKELTQVADEVVALYVPAGLFGAVGSYYQNFDQVSDEEVVAIMKGME